MQSAEKDKEDNGDKDDKKDQEDKEDLEHNEDIWRTRTRKTLSAGKGGQLQKFEAAGRSLRSRTWVRYCKVRCGNVGAMDG